MALLDRPRFILFGDSLTQRGLDTTSKGWAAELANLYSGKVDILVRGFSGYNTRWANLIAGSIFDEAKLKANPPLLVTLFWGANDASLPTSPQHVPLEEFQANLELLVQKVRKACGSTTRIILFSMPPFDKSNWAKWCASAKKPDHMVTGRDEENVEKYATAVKQVAMKLNIPFLDVYALMLAEPDWKTFFVDGLHFSAKGNQFLFKRLVELINSTFPELDATKMPFDFPYWADIDSNDPAKTLASLISSSS